MKLEINATSEAEVVSTMNSNRWLVAFINDNDHFEVRGQEYGPYPQDILDAYQGDLDMWSDPDETDSKQKASEKKWAAVSLESQDEVWKFALKHKTSHRQFAEIFEALDILKECVLWAPKLIEIVDDIHNNGFHRAVIPVWASNIFVSILNPYAYERSEACDYEASVLCGVLEGRWFQS